jgi:hypothetical protein
MTGAGHRLLWAVAAVLAAVYLLLAIPFFLYLLPRGGLGSWAQSLIFPDFRLGSLAGSAGLLVPVVPGLAALELMAWLAAAGSGLGSVPRSWQMCRLLRPFWRPVVAGLLLAIGLLTLAGQLVFIGPARSPFLLGPLQRLINVAFGLLVTGAAAEFLFSWPLGRFTTRVGHATIIASGLKLSATIWGSVIGAFGGALTGIFDLQSLAAAAAGIWLGIAVARLRLQPDRAPAPRPPAGRLAYLLLAGVIFSASVGRTLLLLYLGRMAGAAFGVAAIFVALVLWALLHETRALVVLGRIAPDAVVAPRQPVAEPGADRPRRWPATRGEKIVLAILIILFVLPLVVFGGCVLIFAVAFNGYHN